MVPVGIVTLTTDFGLEGPFVGMMKGVILSRFPAARIVDLTHAVAPQDVAEGAFWLQHGHRWFPRGTVHVAVIDPGVGTARAAVAVLAQGHLFVGPDNGLLAGIVAAHADSQVRRIDPGKLGLTRSTTFDGRDLFAPVAADLAAGRLQFTSLGIPTPLAVGPALPSPRASDGEILGQVVSVDHFGNLITNIEAPMLAELGQSVVEVDGAAVPLLPDGESYATIVQGGFAALVNAHGMLEIAERNGDAARRLGLGRGARVRVVGTPSR